MTIRRASLLLPLVLASLLALGRAPGHASASWSVTQVGDDVQIAYGSGTDFPQYASLDLQSSYFRLNYGPGSGWGTSIVLLPSFWEGGMLHQGALINYSWAIDGDDLLLSIAGTISNLSVNGEVRLFPPGSDVIAADVAVDVNGDVQLDDRPGEAFKPMMLSSMHIASAMWDAQSAYAGCQAIEIPDSGWIVQPPVTASVFGLRGGTSQWNVNAPTIEVRLDQAWPITGWVTPSGDPNDDNVGYWAALDEVIPSWQYRLTATKAEASVEGCVRGLAYGPFRDGQSPGGPCPSRAEMGQDMPRLSFMADSIRTYGLTCNQDLIPAEACQAGLPTLLGAWVSGDPVVDDPEIDKLIAITQDTATNCTVSSVVVGNEVVLFQRAGSMSKEYLIGLMETVKAGLSVPVTTGEPWHIWQANPDLAAAADFLLVYVHPYWEDICLEDAVGWVMSRLSLLESLYPTKEIVLGETGWPTAGAVRAFGCAMPSEPSESNQEHFVRQLLEEASQNGFGLYYFEAFDEGWKTEEPGGVGPNWGLHKSNRRSKHCVATLLPPGPGDFDNDGFTDAAEALLCTDPTNSCAATDTPNDEEPDSWPVDFDDNQWVNILDLLQLTPPVFNSCVGNPYFSERKDLNGDGCINILDFLGLTPPVFNSTCTP